MITIVNHQTTKTVNVMDGILPQLVVLLDLLLEINKDNEFYCGLFVGNERWIFHAECLMDKDHLIQKEDWKRRNVNKSVSGICNIYLKASPSNMFTGAQISSLMPTTVAALHTNP
jgi:hypothetical protein